VLVHNLSHVIDHLFGDVGRAAEGADTVLSIGLHDAHLVEDDNILVEPGDLLDGLLDGGEEALAVRRHAGAQRRHQPPLLVELVLVAVVEPLHVQRWRLWRRHRVLLLNLSIRGIAKLAVLRTHEILVWIRIREPIPLTNGSGSCYFRR